MMSGLDLLNPPPHQHRQCCRPTDLQNNRYYKWSILDLKIHLDNIVSIVTMLLDSQISKEKERMQSEYELKVRVFLSEL